MIKVKTLTGDDIWALDKKTAIIEPFLTAIYQDELTHARKYKTVKGIDWEKYFEAKSEAGFSEQKRWKFVDSREVFVQIDSLWLKPEFGLTEEKISWSLRVEDFIFHDTKIDVQLYAGSTYAINLKVKTKFKESNENPASTPALKWTGQLLDKYESLGHGISFQAGLDAGSSDLVKILNSKIGFNLRFFTVIWPSHKFLFLIMHEEKDFV